MTSRRSAMNLKTFGLDIKKLFEVRYGEQIWRQERWGDEMNEICTEMKQTCNAGFSNENRYFPLCKFPKKNFNSTLFSFAEFSFNNWHYSLVNKPRNKLLLLIQVRSVIKSPSMASFLLLLHNFDNTEGKLKWRFWRWCLWIAPSLLLVDQKRVNTFLSSIIIKRS